MTLTAFALLESWLLIACLFSLVDIPLRGAGMMLVCLDIVNSV
jgi:hypothetical protein